MKSLNDHRKKRVIKLFLSGFSLDEITREVGIANLRYEIEKTR